MVVTARKRSEKLIDVPLAITAMSASALQARNIQGLNELNAFVPGLRYENSAANRNDRSFTSISIRGMYPGDSPNRQAATVFLDGIALSGGSTPGLTDVQQVEVVNGPQSAYFGRSTFSGAINFITREPSFTPQINASASYGSYNTQDFSGSVEGAVIPDKLAVRVSGRHYQTDGDYENAGYSGRLGARETNSFAVAVEAKPTDKLKIKGYFTGWMDSDGPTAQATLGASSYNCAGKGPGTALNYICGTISSAPNSTMSQNISPTGSTLFPGATAFGITKGQPVLSDNFIDHLGLERRAYATHLIADYDLGHDYTLSGAVGLNENKFAVLTDTYSQEPNGTGYSSTVYLPYDQKNESAEIRLTSPQTSKFKFMVGANYFYESIFFQGRAFRPTTLTASSTSAYTTLSAPTLYTANTLGAFGSASYNFTDKLVLSVEGRLQRDKIGQKLEGAGGTALSATYDSFTPRVILSYHINPHMELYTSYSEGVRPGSFNVALKGYSQFVLNQIQAQYSVPIAVPEEKLLTYEGGVKGEFFERRLRLMADIYYGVWHDRQINQNVPYLATPTTTSTSTTTLTLPGGKVDLWGLEAQGSLKVTKELSFDGNFDYAETKINATSCTECLSITGVADPTGNRLARYPAFSGALGMTYERPVYEEWDGYGRLDYLYTGKQYAEESNVLALGASNKFNLHVGVKNSRYTAEIYGLNIFDDKTASNILRNADPRTGANLVVLAPPDRASFGVRVALSY